MRVISLIPWWSSFGYSSIDTFRVRFCRQGRSGDGFGGKGGCSSGRGALESA